MKRHLLVALLLGAFLAPAAAQGINTVPQVGVISATQKQYSYSATAIGLVPAASATDIFCISAGTTRNIAIKQIKIAGTAGTAITTPFLIYRRATVGTGGTPATSTALPVAVPLYTADPASSATLVSYTANPTVAATPLLMDAAVVDLPVTTAAGGSVTEKLTYAENLGWFNHSLVIPKGSTQQICVNLNGVSVSSGVLAISMFWTEQ